MIIVVRLVTDGSSLQVSRIDVAEIAMVASGFLYISGRFSPVGLDGRLKRESTSCELTPQSVQ